MRIAIDIQYPFTTSAKRGIGRYVNGLLKALIKIAHQHELILVLSDFGQDDFEVIRQDIASALGTNQFIIFKAVGPTCWLQSDNAARREASKALRNAFFRALNADIIFIPTLFEGLYDDVFVNIDASPDGPPSAVIIYDLIPFIYPDVYLTFDSARKWYENQIAEIRKADLLLAISDFSRLEAIEYLEFDPNKVVSIYAGIDPLFKKAHFTNEAATQLKDKYCITKPFILTASGVERRKNVQSLIEAFSKLPKNIQDRYQIAVLGCNDQFSKRMVEHVWPNLYGIQPQSILSISHISDEDLVGLYSLCEVFAFPSWHEGFGFPPLEAMACGAPVIAANAGSLPEVVQKSELLFDPHDAQAIANKLELILENQALCHEVSSWGPSHANSFTWERTAQITLDALEQLHARHQPSVKTTNPRFETQTLMNEIIDEFSSYDILEDDDLRAVAEAIAWNEKQAMPYRASFELAETVKWQVEGPFDTSYSLALLNREFARALNELGHDVSLYSTEGPGDFEPNVSFLDQNPDLNKLYRKSLSSEATTIKVVSRNLYPPRVYDMGGSLNFLHSYAWEETGFPQEWVDEFNGTLNGLLCLSDHVKKIMIDHGVTSPLAVGGCGVDHWNRILSDPNFKIKTEKKFKFLHVSSCFPRKGVDLLLEAYGRAFYHNEDVTLIIKTFSNPHNQIHDWLTEVRQKRTHFPEVIIIEEDFSDATMKALFEQCDALVAPSRAEGFGLPLAEAMLSGLSVITTSWGGQTDFCNHNTAWLVDYDFEKANSHFGLFSSAWAQPRLDALGLTLRRVFELPQNEKDQKIQRAQETIRDQFTWKKVAERSVLFARHCASSDTPRPPKIGWVSTWNTRCGIASYSEELVRSLSSDVIVFAPKNQEKMRNDEYFVRRVWDVGESDELNLLFDAILAADVDIIVIQFNYGFFNFTSFSKLLNRLLESRKQIIITLHSTKDPIHVVNKNLIDLKGSLSRCERLLVHSVSDLNRLKAIKLVDNVTLFPLGVLDYKANREHLNRKDEFIIGSYGFALPNKGISELIVAFSELAKTNGNMKLRLIHAEYPIHESHDLIVKCLELIEKLGLSEKVLFENRYLTDVESFELLSDCDLIVFPYQRSGESSSAAVRHGLASGRPVAVTPLSIFDDVEGASYRLPGTRPDQIAEGIVAIQRSIESRDKQFIHLRDQATAWRKQHSYTQLGRRLRGMLIALTQQSVNFEPSEGSQALS